MFKNLAEKDDKIQKILDNTLAYVNTLTSKQLDTVGPKLSQFIAENIDNTKPMSLYECINFVNDYTHQLEETGEATADADRLNEALRAVCDYADGCYVNHCEEIGTEAILDIEEIENEWLEDACDWILKNANKYHIYDEYDNKPTGYVSEIKMKNDFKKYFENKYK